MKILKCVQTPYGMIPSLMLFEGRQSCYLLNREHGTGMLLSHELAASLEEGHPGEALIGKLISRGMMMASEHQRESGIHISFFLIDMTQNCNFACKYCLRDPDLGNGRISLEMLDRILDRIIDYCRTHHEYFITIQPWGGEPLLEAEKIFHIREKMSADAPEIHLNISIETNGSLITPQLAKRLKEAGIRIGVSIDGPRRIHDENRVAYAGGHPTFDDVCKGIRALYDAGETRIGSISVITKKHIPMIPEILDFFTENFPEMSVKINPMHSPGNAEEIPDAVGPEEMPGYIRTLTDSVIRLHQRGINVREANVTTALRNLLYRDPDNICKSHGCQGGRQMVIFDRNGSCFPCEMVNYPEEKLMDLSDSVDLNEAVEHAMAANRYFRPKFKEECGTCPWWYFCMGGCTSAMMYRGREEETVDECGCEGTKALYTEMVKLMTEDSDLAQRIAGSRQLYDSRDSQGKR